MGFECRFRLPDTADETLDRVNGLMGFFDVQRVDANLYGSLPSETENPVRAVMKMVWHTEAAIPGVAFAGMTYHSAIR